MSKKMFNQDLVEAHLLFLREHSLNFSFSSFLNSLSPGKNQSKLSRFQK
jgi:hypothetical protein